MFIIGHRGARAVAPENTLAAVQKGMQCADYVEVDVRLSRDGIPVVIHDPTLDRTSSGKGPVRKYSVEELRRFDAGGGERIPTFEEVLYQVRGPCGLIVEIKEPGSEEAVCRLLKERSPERTLVVSFHDKSLVTAKKLLPQIRTGLIYSQEPENPLRAAQSVHAYAILPRFDRVTKDLVDRAHRLLMLVIPWTLNTGTEFWLAKEYGCDGFATDDPCAGRRYLQSQGS